MGTDFAIAFSLLAFVLAALSLAFAARVLTGVEKQHENFMKSQVVSFRAEIAKSSKEVSRLAADVAAVDDRSGKADGAQVAAVAELKREIAALNVRLSALEKPAIRPLSPVRPDTYHHAA